MRNSLAAFVVVATAACATFPLERATDSIQPMVNETGSCTAWAVGPTQWMTAKHCLVVGGAEGWTIAGVPASVLALDPTFDVALVSGPVSRPLSVSDAAPPLGAVLTTFGYGMSRADLLFFDGRLMVQSSSFFDGSDSEELLIGGANGMPGMSGGPMLWRGRVVSQVSGGGTASSPTHLVGSGVPFAALKAFVQRHVRR